MTRTVRSWALACLAAGLVGTAAPIPPAQAQPAEPAFGGYSAEAVATPVKVEVYEPVVPIPAQPQIEAELAYTKAESASGPTGAGVASWLWPGDSVGQGFKTFMEAFGLGETGLGDDGYPVQVNSRTPGQQNEEKDEPFPGSLMRTSSGPEGVRSTVGWSTNCDVSETGGTGGDKPDGDDGEPGGGDDEPGGGTPGLPGLPEAPELPALGDLGSLGAAITGKDRAAAEEKPGADCQVPAQLQALVDVDGMVSDARTETGEDAVASVAVSKLGNLSLLGGVITADQITVRTRTSADGKKPTASGAVRIGGLELQGTPITFTQKGVELAGEKHELPGLPPDPEKALEELGIKLVLPKPQQRAKGDEASATYEGLRVIVDTRPLRAYLKDVPFDEVFKAIPDQEGLSELKSALQAVTQLAPKFVITLGNAATETATVPMMDFDLGDLPTVDPSQLNGAGAPPLSSGGTTGGGLAAGGAGAPGGLAEAAGDAAGGEAIASRPASAGLPPLASIPGALMAGGLVLATGIGWWLQKMGGLVLGGAGSCAHGLETGVPDLRRA